MAAAPATITVIIAVRNGAATLQRALDSVFEQTYEHVELIVMDGGSTDGTAKIIKRNAARIAYWESKPDRGISHAWNKALDHATGDWICFLGADDRLHAPEVLARLAPTLAEAATGHRVLYGRVRVVQADGSTARTLGDEWDSTVFRDHMSTPHPATFHHRALFERHGRFDERYRIAGDYEFLLRELLTHEPRFVSECVVDMGSGGLSDRPATVALLAREAHRARYAHGLEATPEWRSFRVMRAVLHAWLARLFGRRTADAVGSAYRFIVRRPDGGEP